MADRNGGHILDRVSQNGLSPRFFYRLVILFADRFLSATFLLLYTHVYYSL